MGRPPKHPVERRILRLPQPRVTLDEMAKIEMAAQELGLSVSEFIVRRAVGDRLPSRNARDLGGLLLEVNRIGVNLNQIAKAANSTGAVPASITPMMTLIEEAMERIITAMGDESAEEYERP